MKTSDLLEHPDSFEHRLRVGLEHISEAGSVSSPGRFDPEAMLADPPSKPRSSRWLLGAAAAAVVVLGIGGLIVANRQDAGPAPTASPDPSSSAITPALLDTAPATTDLATVEQRSFLFPDAESTMRYLDPVDVLDAYLADRITTAPPGQTVTYTVSPDGPPFDGSPDRVLIGFELTVTPDDPALCCDSGNGVAYIEQVDGAWFVMSAEISAMQVTTLRYSDDGVVSVAFSPTIGGTYTVTVAGFGSPAPEADSIVVEHEPDPADPTNGPTLELPGFSAPSVAVRFWQSPSVETPYPAAMFAEFIIAKGTENASNISIDPSASATVTAADKQSVPGTSVAPTPDVSTTTIVTSVSDELSEALRPDGRILVVNATTTAGLGGSLSQALTDSGYVVLNPTNAADGTIVDESVIYTRADTTNMMTPNAIMNAVPIRRGESLSGQATPALTQEMIDNADIIIVVGTDLASAPWHESGTSLFNPGIGRLLIIDANTNDRNQRATDMLAQDLRAAGVDIAGLVTAAAPIEGTMLMPIGQSTPWTFAIAELAGVGGFDTWNPSLITEPIPDGVTAALVIGNNS
jgi:hypothetical protein